VSITTFKLRNSHQRKCVDAEVVNVLKIARSAGFQQEKQWASNKNIHSRREPKSECEHPLYRLAEKWWLLRGGETYRKVYFKAAKGIVYSPEKLEHQTNPAQIVVTGMELTSRQSTLIWKVRNGGNIVRDSCSYRWQILKMIFQLFVRRSLPEQRRKADLCVGGLKMPFQARISKKWSFNIRSETHYRNK